MAEDSTINPTEPTADKNPAQERITQLSDKVKEEATAKEAALERATVAERNAAFAEQYADIVATNPAAKEYKADIKAKVDAGYSVEDATYAVLGKAGKLGATVGPTPQVAGGSATTTITQVPTKEVKDMTLAEKRAQLEKDLIWQ